MWRGGGCFVYFDESLLMWVFFFFKVLFVILKFQDREAYSKVRTNSAIHIRVYKKQLSDVSAEGASKEAT